jgi:DNA (cytosine-5)-methyltransferase 1
MSARPKVLELFAGGGGLALGLHRAGFEHSGLIEIDKTACATLALNQRHLGISFVPEATDIRDVDFRTYAGSVDVIAAGVPCQPFSQAGKHLGYRDQRNLFPFVLDAVRECAPKAVVIENVYALLRPRFAHYYEYVLRQLRTPGLLRKPGEKWISHSERLRLAHEKGHQSGAALAYRVAGGIVQAADFGVPQTRSRVFIVALHKDLETTWQSPYADPAFKNEMRTREALLHAMWVDGSYWRQHGLRQPSVPAHVRDEVRRLATQEEPSSPRWLTVRDALASIQELRTSALDLDDVIHGGARSYEGHTGSVWDWPSKTLKAGVHGVAGGENMLRHRNGRVRYFTVREAGLLQTFPADYDFGGCAWGPGLRLVGNAVPVELAGVISSQVARHLAVSKGSQAQTPSRAA